MRWFLVVVAVILCWTIKAEVPVVSYPMLNNVSLTHQTPFDTLGAEFKLAISDKDKHIDYWRKYYLADRYHLKVVMNNMIPFLPLILQRIKDKGLPGELAIIPMVESCYRVNEGSQQGAIGLWQINAITAVQFQLVDQWNYDARLDVMQTTEAALSYLEKLHQQFKSWPLVFAAYNAGPGRVKAALKKIHYRYDSDFYKLDLPQQTLDFVPKILALAQLIKFYEFYDLSLPDQCDELVPIKCSHPIDFRDFILAFSVPLNILVKYNPGFSMYMIPKNKEHAILIPRSYLKNQPIESIPDKLLYINKHPVYRVKRGDSMSVIAAQFSLTVAHLMDHNNLGSTLLQPGQLLLIPPISIMIDKYLMYTVKPGDSLYSIARAHDTSVNNIMTLNQLKSTTIKINQVLRIPKV
jgi:membrane-bound lytic murein transglycosylase D